MHNRKLLTLEYVKKEPIIFLCIDYELDFLNEKYNSNKAEFIVLYGRRRIGKTALIQEFIKDKKNIFYMATQTSSFEQLSAFSNAILSFTKDEKNYILKDWDSCFDQLYKISKDERVVVVIDEFPYIVKKDDNVPSLLQRG